LQGIQLKIAESESESRKATKLATELEQNI